MERDAKYLLDWVRDCATPEEKERRIRDLLSAKNCLEHLSKILDKKKTKVYGSSQYDMPAWPYFMADAVGYNRALEEIQNLIINAITVDPTKEK